MGVLGDSIILIIPMLVSGWIVDRGFSEQQAGFLSSIEMCGLAAASVAGLYWLHRINWRKVAALALLGIIAGNVITLFINDYLLFASVRSLTGFCSGTLTALAWVAIAQTAQPERNFGFVITAEVLFAAIALWSLPYLMQQWGVNSAYLLLIFFATVVFTGISQIPSDHYHADSDTTNTSHIPWRALLVLLGLSCFFGAQSAVWTYVERIGDYSGLSADSIGQSLSLSNAAAITGAFIPVLMGLRFGRLIPIGINLLAQLAALSIIMSKVDYLSYVIALSLFNFSWNFIIPYILGLLADIDSSGKAMVVSGIFVWGGFATGPAIAAWLLNGNGYAVVCAIGAIGCIASFILLTPAAYKLKQLARQK
tara:strand:+ start:28537 stop:29634 length:1098 start_codon:yes stop_codon:yes gene_type:complete